jgi:anti-sigma B factor antagonist
LIERFKKKNNKNSIEFQKLFPRCIFLTENYAIAFWHDALSGMFLKKLFQNPTYTLSLHTILIGNTAYMKYQIDEREHYTVLTLQEANLNSVMAPDLKSKFFLLKQEGARNLILDLSTVQFVDSSGLSAILTAHRLWKSDGAFVMCGELNGMVRRLIEISRLDTILTHVATVDDAIERVMSPSTTS